jgi:hypothetical protein
VVLFQLAMMLNVGQISKDFLIRFVIKKWLKCLKFGVPKVILLITPSTLGTLVTLVTLVTVL